MENERIEFLQETAHEVAELILNSKVSYSEIGEILRVAKYEIEHEIIIRP